MAQTEGGSSFFSRVMTLMAGSVSAQLLVLASIPVLTRLFSPEAMGELGVFTACGSILGIMVLGCYDRAVLLAHDRDEAVFLVKLCLTVLLVVAGIAGIVLFGLSLFLNGIVREISPTAQLIASNWYWILLLAIAIGVFQTFSAWLIYLQQFRVLAQARFFQSFVQVAIQTLSGFAGLSSLGLMVGLVFGWSFGALLMAGRGFSRRAHTWFKKASVKRECEVFKSLASRYRNFPKYTMTAELGSALASYLPLIVLGMYFESADVGYYLITQKAVSAPSSFIGNAIRDVFRGQAAEEFRMTGACRATFLSTLRSLCYMAILPSMVLLIAAPAIFGFVFGETWRPAGEMVQIMAPMIFVSFVMYPLSQMFNIGERQMLDFVSQAVLLVLTIAALFVGGRTDSLRLALGLMSFVYTLVYGVRIVFAYQIARGGVLKGSKRIKS